MNDVVDMLQQRKRVLEDSIRNLQDELVRVSAALKAYDPRSSAYSSPGLPPKRRGDGKPSLKQMAFTVLAQRPTGATARMVLKDIADQYGVFVERSSLSPQLSRLQQDRVLGRTGLTWFVRDDVDPDVRKAYYIPARLGQREFDLSAQ